jgi:uncharacterized repeat protein (TIGR01451 family)
MKDFFRYRENATFAAITFFAVISLSLLWLTPTAADTGLALGPTRPPLPTEPSSHPVGPERPEAEGLSGPPGTTIHGLVVNWGYHNEPHTKIRLRGGGWDLEATSDDNGYYRYQGLSEGIAFLSLVLPEGSALKPMTTDVAVQMKGSGQLVVNMGLYSSPTAPTLPAGVSMSVEPEVAAPGDTVLYTIQATNNLPHGISQVVVTDYLPEDLVPVEATVSHSTVEIWNNLVVADIGEMAVGDTAVVIIEARVKDNVTPGAVIQNRASFIYAESVAAQAVASLTIGGVRPMGTPAPESRRGLPVTGFGLPIAGVLFALLVLIARQLRPKPVDET